MLSLMNFSIQRKHRNACKKKPTRYNTSRLSQPEVKEKFQKEIAEEIRHINSESVDNSWTELREARTKTCSTELGRLARHSEDWFDDNDEEIKALMNAKRSALRVWQSDYRNKQKRSQYHDNRSKVQNKVRRLKNDWWVRKSEEIQTLADKNCTREFFAATRKLYGPSSIGARPIAVKDGTICKEKEQIKARWGEHFGELLNQETPVNENVLDKIPQLQTNESLALPPTIDELRKAIKTAKQGKAAGPDGIPAEIFKHGGDELTQKLLDLFQKIWESETLPADLRGANIVTIFKKRNKAECGNYRGISLLFIAGKPG